MLHPRYVPQSTSAGRYREESSRRRLGYTIIAGLVLVFGGVIFLVVRPRNSSQASSVRSPTASPIYDSEGAGRVFVDFTDFPTASPTGNLSMTGLEPSASPTTVLYDTNDTVATFPNTTSFPSSAPSINPTLKEGTNNQFTNTPSILFP